MRTDEAGFGVAIWATLTMVLVPLPSVANAPLTADQIAQRMDEADAANMAALKNYTVVRHYVLHNERFQKHGEMMVNVTYRAGAGKTFEILANNAEGVQKKVFERLLEAEKASATKGTQEEMRISPRNYTFQLLGNETRNGVRCYVLDMKPKVKNKYALEGRIWVSTDDYGLIHLEGLLAQRISFWIGKPQITQTFKKVGPVWMMTSNRSVAEVKILGTTALSIDSTDFRVSLQDAHSTTVAMRDVKRPPTE